jgi:hypothetical protein
LVLGQPFGGARQLNRAATRSGRHDSEQAPVSSIVKRNGRAHPALGRADRLAYATANQTALSRLGTTATSMNFMIVFGHLVGIVG